MCYHLHYVKGVSHPQACVCSTKQGELYGDRTAGFHGYSHLTGGFDGGQAEYARVPFGESHVIDSLHTTAGSYTHYGVCWQSAEG